MGGPLHRRLKANLDTVLVEFDLMSTKTTVMVRFFVSNRFLKFLVLLQLLCIIVILCLRLVDSRNIEVINACFTPPTRTRQDSFVLSVSVVWNRLNAGYQGLLAPCWYAIQQFLCLIYLAIITDNIGNVGVHLSDSSYQQSFVICPIGVVELCSNTALVNSNSVLQCCSRSFVIQSRLIVIVIIIGNLQAKIMADDSSKYAYRHLVT